MAKARTNDLCDARGVSIHGEKKELHPQGAHSPVTGRNHGSDCTKRKLRLDGYRHDTIAHGNSNTAIFIDGGRDRRRSSPIGEGPCGGLRAENHSEHQMVVELMSMHAALLLTSTTSARGVTATATRPSKVRTTTVPAGSGVNDWGEIPSREGDNARAGV